MSSRVGHIHVRLDDAQWVWADASGNPIILMGLSPGPHKVSLELATDPTSLDRFFRDLPNIDHVMVTAGRPYYARLRDMDFAQVRRLVDEHLLLVLQVARNAVNKVRPGGTLLFMSGTGGRRAAIGLGVTSALTAAIPALIGNLALELAPIRVNPIAAGFVDTPLSAELLGDDLEKRRNQLRSTLPIRASSNRQTSLRSLYTS